MDGLTSGLRAACVPAPSSPAKHEGGPLPPTAMADSSGHHQTLRFPRGRGHSITSRNNTSRNPSGNRSARSSAVYDDGVFLRPPLPPFAGQQQQQQQHALRPAESRVSLNEHFAASRPEYEFGDEDNISVWYDRATLASEFGDDAPAALDGAVDDYDLTDDAVAEMERVLRMLQGDYYDLLCLPRDASLAPEQIRRAYYRLFLLFYPESYPETLRAIAQRQFERAQEAFETLIDPERRARYDLTQAMDDAASTGPERYDDAFREAVWQRFQSGMLSTSDLGVRFSAGRRRGNPGTIGSMTLRALDFSLGNSVTLGLPALRRSVEPGLRAAFNLLTSPPKQEKPSDAAFELGTPQLALSGSVYGVVDDISQIPIPLLSERYQPLLPQLLPRRRLIQLVESRLSPWVSLSLRQEISNRAASELPRDRPCWVKTCVQVETDVLPRPAVATLVQHHVRLPNAAEPSIFEVGVKTPSAGRVPRLVLGARHRFRGSTAFVTADSGDWMIRRGETCRFIDRASGINGVLAWFDFPLHTAPRVEAGLSTRSLEQPQLAAFPDGPRDSGGIRCLDQELRSAQKGSWTVSCSTAAHSLGACVRYSRDVMFTSTSSQRGHTSRLEVELCPDIYHQDRFLAVRNLWPVSRLSNFGLEIGISQYNVHLSLYWSRLGQRLSLPLLISPCRLLSPKLIFWGAILPLTSLATLRLLSSSRRPPPPQPPVNRPLDLSGPVVQAAVSRRRSHADALTSLLAHPVDARQRRRASAGGLVVLSAKLGLQDPDDGGWAGEEVADVTVALAALADDTREGRILVPAGVRKARIPGFWDPAPGQEKVLHVRYLWKGREGVVEVRGQAELVLPPC